VATGIVKSGGRSLEVLAFFADCREASVMDVARALGYPQSSASELLKTMTGLGYLRYDARRRMFAAGARAGLLGAALSARVLGVQDVAGLVEHVTAATTLETHICDVIGDRVHYLVGPARRRSERAPAPLLGSAAGLLFLAAMRDADAASLAAREGGAALSAPSLAEQLSRVRRTGHALLCGGNGAELAIALNRQPGLALSLTGAALKCEEEAAGLARRARDTVRRWRGPLCEAARLHS